ncbi:MAG: transcription-repair coupling factor [Planctomycetaceae bacterium]
MARQKLSTIRELSDLVALVQRAEGFADVVTSLQRGEPGVIDGTWGSACALTIASLAKEANGPLLVVTPRIADVDDLALDISGFLGDAPVVFPAWETLPQEHDPADAIFGGRLRVLSMLQSNEPPRVVVASLPALLQPVPSREERQSGTKRLRVGDELPHEEFLTWLVERGFRRVPAIEVPGEFSVHGGILDLYPPDADDPYRLEFFGDEIDSIRRFDVETQRKIEELQEVSLTVVTTLTGESLGEENAATGTPAELRLGESFLDSLPAGSWIALTELQELVLEGRQYLARLNDPRGLFSVEAALARMKNWPTAQIAAIAEGTGEARCSLHVESIERFTGPRNAVLEELAETLERDEQVVIACHNEGERSRLTELLAESELLSEERVTFCLGFVERGFRLVAEKTVVIGDHELFGRVHVQRHQPAKKRYESRAIDSFLELKQGDLVVHLTNGIGRFRGMELLTKGEKTEEYLKIEFHGKTFVYVPVALIHLVQKYVGSAKTAPKLSKVGGKTWAKKKQKVAEAVTDMAAEMIRMQAARAAQVGMACPPDSHWQHEFEAAFPYTATDDQLQAIEDVKRDMQAARPMDRLICGDVGYGKTEVAMRAAFKAIEAGKQVAVLVPTTVLAEQHYRTFCERMAEFPVTIDTLSRFRTKAEQREILARAETGGTDIVIGTHRLVQKDVRFKDLGLLIIDEEQRFGVEAKEMLKRMRLDVDVLTLSATPIPRTLHMSLLGIRDISNLTTAPQERQAIETRVVRFDPELIRRAIVRELNRNGQVYFVHNRVYNIQSIADRIQSIVPEAKIGIGHGQMPEHQLEQAMHDFVSGKTDILVSTTIIESGLDIPNANTIFIHQANIYGLADLHQLRGRVGRYRHRAYCYLMLEDGKPLTPTAAKRMKAIEEFSELGAGFKIAMRDLEIRGAGNILGTEQSGHISAVGYELYCQLVENAVRKLKNEPLREHRHVAVDLPITAFLPDDYIPPGRQKIEMYRRLGLAASEEELRDVVAEFNDRFGPMPKEAQRLVSRVELQIAARKWQVDDIHLEEGYAVLGYRNAQRIRELANCPHVDLRVVDTRSAYLPLPAKTLREDAILEYLKTVLQQSQ